MTLSGTATNYCQNVNENVDDVQVEIESSKDVFFWGDGVPVFAT